MWKSCRIHLLGKCHHHQDALFCGISCEWIFVLSWQWSITARTPSKARLRPPCPWGQFGGTCNPLWVLEQRKTHDRMKSLILKYICIPAHWKFIDEGRFPWTRDKAREFYSRRERERESNATAAWISALCLVPPRIILALDTLRPGINRRSFHLQFLMNSLRCITFRG